MAQRIDDAELDDSFDFGGDESSSKTEPTDFDPYFDEQAESGLDIDDADYYDSSESEDSNDDQPAGELAQTRDAGNTPADSQGIVDRGKTDVRTSAQAGDDGHGGEYSPGGLDESGVGDDAVPLGAAGQAGSGDSQRGKTGVRVGVSANQGQSEALPGVQAGAVQQTEQASPIHQAGADKPGTVKANSRGDNLLGDQDADTFNLEQQTAKDGARIQSERDRARAKAEADKARDEQQQKLYSGEDERDVFYRDAAGNKIPSRDVDDWREWLRQDDGIPPSDVTEIQPWRAWLENRKGSKHRKLKHTLEFAKQLRSGGDKAAIAYAKKIAEQYPSDRIKMFDSLRSSNETSAINFARKQASLPPLAEQTVDNSSSTGPEAEKEPDKASAPARPEAEKGTHQESGQQTVAQQTEMVYVVESRPGEEPRLIQYDVSDAKPVDKTKRGHRIQGWNVKIGEQIRFIDKQHVITNKQEAEAKYNQAQKEYQERVRNDRIAGLKKEIEKGTPIPQKAVDELELDVPSDWVLLDDGRYHPPSTTSAETFNVSGSEVMTKAMEPTLKAASIKGENPLWYVQGDPNQVVFNANQSGASDWEKQSSKEIKAAQDAGYSPVRYRISGLQGIYVFQKPNFPTTQAKILTKAGMESLVGDKADKNLASTPKVNSEVVRFLSDDQLPDLGSMIDRQKSIAARLEKLESSNVRSNTPEAFLKRNEKIAKLNGRLSRLASIIRKAEKGEWEFVPLRTGPTKAQQKKQARDEKTAAIKSQDEADRARLADVIRWIDERLSETEMNDYNKLTLARMLAGESEYSPMVNWRWLEPMHKLGAVSGEGDNQRADWKKLQAIYDADKAAAPKQAASASGKRNKVKVKSARDNLDPVKRAKLDELQAKLRGNLLGGASMNAMLDPENVAITAQIAQLYSDGGVKTFRQFANNVAVDMADVWDMVKDFLHGAWQMAGSQDDSLDDVSRTDARSIISEIDAGAQESDNKSIEEGTNDVPSTTGNLEQDNELPGTTDAVGSDDALDGGRGSQQGNPAGSQQDSSRAGDGKPGDSLVLDSDAADGGAEADSGLHSGEAEYKPDERSTGSKQRARSGDVDDDGAPVDTSTTDLFSNPLGETDANTPGPLEPGDKPSTRRGRQKLADSVAVKPADEANIRKTLPLLLPGQQDDVLFAENRFAKPDGYGVLFTNGTGTGKTYSGIGIVKRFVRQGKDNVLILAPNQEVVNGWMGASKDVLIPIKQLASTNDNGGSGVVVTTYANLRANPSLVQRQWDLVIADESQELLQRKGSFDVSITGAMFRAVTHHPRGEFTHFRMSNKDFLDSYDATRDKYEEAKKDFEKDDPRLKRIGDKLEKMDAEYRRIRDEHSDEYAELVKSARSRVVFLSATPFAYVPNVDYAEGYLFHYPVVEDSSGYNTENGQQMFFIQHFGYKMRYNRLERPDREVDNDVMEREFNEFLVKEKVISGRRLEINADYERRFVLTPDHIGTEIDSGMKVLSEQFPALHEIARNRFDYLHQLYLLEAIKAKHAVPLIKKQLKRGRKVVVFHDYNKGGAFHPFDFSTLSGDVRITDADGKSKKVPVQDVVKAFNEAYPQYAALDFSGLASPINTLQQAFPDAGFINGNHSKREINEAMDLFNSDDSGPQVIVAQSAKAGAGISLHDTSGKYPRVSINLGLPTRPVTAIQEEGRIYRTGQADGSNSLYLYMNTGTNWEAWAFASKMFERSSTAENLAMGHAARRLRHSFVEAFDEAEPYRWNPNEGTGGKENDRNADVVDDFTRAKAFYFGRQKKTSRTKAKEGTDYFATPEPLGLKMVEWADIKPGEHILEPSAGHGAISRWFSELSDNTIIEQSDTLAAEAAIHGNAKTKAIRGSFEDHNIVNKYHAITMNPPFGAGGKTAMDHVAKAFTHLVRGGRIVAIIPDGPSMNKRFDKWYEETKDASLVADIKLPGVVFKRAGTGVKTRIVIIDRVDEQMEPVNDYRNMDIGSDDINDFFGRIENIDMPNRQRVNRHKAKREKDIQQDGNDEISPVDAASILQSGRDSVLPNQPKPTQSSIPAEATKQYDDDSGFDIRKTYHEKRGMDVFILVPTKRVDRGDYQRILAAAKYAGGWKSPAYRVKKLPFGFGFPSREAAVEFAVEHEDMFGHEQNSKEVREQIEPYGKTLIPTVEKIRMMLHKAGITHEQFNNKFGFAPEALTEAQIQQYLLNGAAGVEGLAKRIPQRPGQQGGASIVRDIQETFSGAPRRQGLVVDSTEKQKYFIREGIPDAKHEDASKTINGILEPRQLDLFPETKQAVDPKAKNKSVSLKKLAPNPSNARSRIGLKLSPRKLREIESRTDAERKAWYSGKWKEAFEAVGEGRPVMRIIPELISSELPMAVPVEGMKITTPDDVHAIMTAIRSPYFESFKTIWLDSKNRAIRMDINTVGVLDSSAMHPSVILRKIPDGAVSVIISHNHPSGDPSPSREDVIVTRELDEALSNNGIRVLDHIVTNGTKYFSLREHGQFESSEPVPVWERGKPPRRSNKDVPKAQRKADWELVEQTDEFFENHNARSPELVRKFINKLADGSQYIHVVYLNTKLGIVGVERMDTDIIASKAKARINRNGAVSGADSAIVHLPNSLSESQDRYSHAVKWSRALAVGGSNNGIKIIDVVTPGKDSSNYDQYTSMIESGLLVAEGGVPYLSKSRTPNPRLSSLQTQIDAVPPKADGSVDMEARQRVLDEWKRANPEAVREIESSISPLHDALKKTIDDLRKAYAPSPLTLRPNGTLAGNDIRYQESNRTSEPVSRDQVAAEGKRIAAAAGVEWNILGAGPVVGRMKIGPLSIEVRYQTVPNATDKAGAMVRKGNSITIYVDPRNGDKTTFTHEAQHIANMTMFKHERDAIKRVLGFDLSDNQGEEDFTAALETAEGRTEMITKLRAASNSSQNMITKAINRVIRTINAIFGTNIKQFGGDFNTVADMLDGWNSLRRLAQAGVVNDVQPAAVYQDQGRDLSKFLGRPLREAISSMPDNPVPPEAATAPRGGNLELRTEAIRIYTKFPKTVIASDNRKIQTVIKQGPETPTFTKTAVHLASFDDRNTMNRSKLRWMPIVPETLRNATAILYDKDNGTDIYVRRYGDMLHSVVVGPEGLITEHDVEYGLVTQFADDEKDKKKPRRLAMPIIWAHGTDIATTDATRSAVRRGGSQTQSSYQDNDTFADGVQEDIRYQAAKRKAPELGPDPDLPKRLKHFTSAASAAALQGGAVFDSTGRQAQHPIEEGYSGRASEVRFAGNRLYLSLDDDYWGSKTETDMSIPAVEAGVSDISDNDAVFYDYKNQKWMKRPNAKKRVELTPVDIQVNDDATTLLIDSPAALQDALGKAGLRGWHVGDVAYDNNKTFFNALAEDGVDVLVIRNTGLYKKSPFFASAGHDQAIVLNPSAVTILDADGNPAQSPVELGDNADKAPDPVDDGDFRADDNAEEDTGEQVDEDGNLITHDIKDIPADAEFFLQTVVDGKTTYKYRPGDSSSPVQGHRKGEKYEHNQEDVNKAQQLWNDSVAFAASVYDSVFRREKMRKSSNAKPDITELERNLSTLLHYSKKVPGLLKLHEAAMDWLDNKARFENEIFNQDNGKGESDLTLLLDYRRKHKLEWKRLEGYLWEKDIKSGQGHISIIYN